MKAASVKQSTTVCQTCTGNQHSAIFLAFDHLLAVANTVVQLLLLLLLYKQKLQDMHIAAVPTFQQLQVLPSVQMLASTPIRYSRSAV